MNYLLIVLSAITLASCAYQPSHLGITPGMEWEMQKHSETKYKPKIQTTLDWNF